MIELLSCRRSNPMSYVIRMITSGAAGTGKDGQQLLLADLDNPNAAPPLLRPYIALSDNDQQRSIDTGDITQL